MAISRRRRAGAEDLVQVTVLLGRDDTVHVRSATAHDIAPDDLARAATVMCVEWAVRWTLTDSGWSHAQVERHLALICASRSASEYNTRINADTVAVGAPPPGTVGETVHGRLTQDADGKFLTHWRMPEGCAEPREAARVLAVLWSLAEQAGYGTVVQHALYALRGGFGGEGQFTPSEHSRLATSLVAFGVEMTQADRQAAESRSRMRAV